MRLFWRPFEESDREQLEQWRRDYAPASLELPHDYTGPSNETVVVTAEDGRMILSLTGTNIVGLDPLLRDPNADPHEVSKALEMAEAILTFLAAKSGAVDAFIAVPDTLTDYHKFLAKRGYEQTAQHCVIFRKAIGRPPVTHVDLPKEVEAT